MSYFIIIRGPLGSGKSTISAKLSQLLKAEHIHTDEILEHNGLDTVPEGAPCIPKENFIKANEIILPKVKKNLQAGIPVIFDACFYHQEVIEHLIKNLPFNHYIFTLKAPLDLCIKRDAERPKSHGEGAAMAVHSLVSRFDYGTNIDVTGTLNQSVENVRDHLPRFKKIVVLDKVTLSAGIVKQLDPFSETPIEIFGTDPADNSEIIKRITDADCILLTWRTPITKEIIEACPELKFICLCATNSNLIDLEECAKHNITISNIKDYGDEGVVEWIFCQLITLVRGLGKHQWRDQISEIGEKKIGIIGMGTIGKMIATVALNFNMQVLYFSKTRNQEYEQKGVQYVEKKDLLQKSDFITLQTPRNLQILEKSDFKLMKEKVLINNTLGKAFEEQDFRHWIAQPNNFLIIDMASDFKDEFKDLERVILANKVSGLTAEAAERLSNKALDNITTYLYSDI